MFAGNVAAFVRQNTGEQIERKFIHKPGCHINARVNAAKCCCIGPLVSHIIKLRGINAKLLTDRGQETVYLRHLVFTETDRVR